MGLLGYAEPLLGLLSGAVAEPVAGWTGLLSGDAGAVNRMRDALTYQPHTQEGQLAQSKIADLLMGAKQKIVDENPPVRGLLDAYQGASDWVGSKSPVLGAAMQTAPTAAMAFMGPGSSATRQAFSSVGHGVADGVGTAARAMYENAGAAPAVRGPLTDQGGALTVFAPNRTYPKQYEKVLDEMRQLGAPTIRAVWDGESYKAIEGSHRLAAAKELGLTPNIEEISLKSWLTDHDLSELPEKTSVARAYQYLYDRPEHNYFFPDLSR